MRRVAKRLVSTGVLDVVATAIPGIREILVLGKVKQLERSGVWDLIVLDAPAAGHAVTFLTSALGLMDAARGGPLRAQAQDVVEMLRDPARCQVMLVSLPEETPVNELVETAYRFEDLVGVALAPVVVNACYPSSLTSAPIPWRLPWPPANQLPGQPRPAGCRPQRPSGQTRQNLQAAQVARLAAGLPLAQLALPSSSPPSSARATRGAVAGPRGRNRRAQRRRRSMTGEPDAEVASLSDLVTERSVIVCCGRAESARRRSPPRSGWRGPRRAGRRVW